MPSDQYVRDVGGGGGEGRRIVIVLCSSYYFNVFIMYISTIVSKYEIFAGGM